MNQTPLEEQWDKLIQQEANFLKKCAEKKPSRLDTFLEEKVPDTLQSTLDTAFAKSFTLIFEKGTAVIEKSYQKDEQILKHKINRYAYSLKPDKKRLRQFEKESGKSQRVNVMISGVKGIGLGLLGIGLPDIPIFIGMVLKGIYEIALRYGCTYDQEEDQFFILTIIATALSHGETVVLANQALDTYIENHALPAGYDRETQIEAVANILSTELLCMKFLQGLPIVGVVGGVADAVFLNQILDYAKLKYKRKFLFEQRSIHIKP